MELVAHILRTANSGGTVRMMTDGAGNRWAVVGGRFLRRKTTEFDLTREQYEVLRYALKRRRSGGLFARYRPGIRV